MWGLERDSLRADTTERSSRVSSSPPAAQPTGHLQDTSDHSRRPRPYCALWASPVPSVGTQWQGLLFLLPPHHLAGDQEGLRRRLSWEEATVVPRPLPLPNGKTPAHSGAGPGGGVLGPRDPSPAARPELQGGLPTTPRPAQAALGTWALETHAPVVWVFLHTVTVVSGFLTPGIFVTGPAEALWGQRLSSWSCF